jgi:hypothetical protein
MLKLLRLGFDWMAGIRKPAQEAHVVFELSLDRLPVGNLRLENGEWVFSYSPEFRAQSEIKPIVGFPALDREYRAAELWPFFALRIPSPEQPEVRHYIRREKDVNQVKLLERFGHRSVANPFSLTLSHA